MERYGDWIQTFTGLQFWPLDPRPEEICIEDIAHALANTCRFSGHTERFYSVAEHSVVLAWWALDREGMTPAGSERLARLALMHDATEAYLSDVPRPLKRFMPEFEAAEGRLAEVIYRRFGIETDEESDTALKDADTRILLDEREALLKRPPNVWSIDHLEPLNVLIRALRPEMAEAEFMSLARRLLVALPPNDPLTSRSTEAVSGCLGDRTSLAGAASSTRHSNEQAKGPEGPILLPEGHER